MRLLLAALVLGLSVGWSLGKEGSPWLSEMGEAVSSIWEGILSGLTNPAAAEEQAQRYLSPNYIARLFSVPTQPWWRGPHVCSREEHLPPSSYNLTHSSNDLDYDDNATLLDTNSVVSNCREEGDSYRCDVRVRSGSEERQHSVVYECCLGWGRSAGSGECTTAGGRRGGRVWNLLERLNASLFRDLLRETGVEKEAETSGRPFTVFVPPGHQLRRLLLEKQNLSGPELRAFVRSLLTPHILPASYHSRAWVLGALPCSRAVSKVEYFRTTTIVRRRLGRTSLSV